ncbi:MAG: hypothetical protein WCX94_03190 [Candidatus Dojkabacteria bacterium]
MFETEKLPGTRVSASTLERLIPTYEGFKMTDEIAYSDVENPNIESIEKRAKSSFAGTQIHNLVYFTRLYDRCKLLNRPPNYMDLRDTFPTSQLDDSKAYEILYSQNEDPVQAWRQWILNCDMPKENGLSTILDPEVIMGIWQSGINNPDTDKVLENLPKPNLELWEMNEVLTILNLELNRNFQFPSSVDTILISKDSRNKPITIIDYKTGREASEISFPSKLQAMLMSISIYYNFIDEIPKASWGLSEWDVAYPTKAPNLPHFKKRASLGPKRINCSIGIDAVCLDIEKIAKKVEFLYINPITGEEHEVEYLPIAMEGLDYLDELNEFYIAHKSELGKPKIYDFLTPKFKPMKILDHDAYLESNRDKGTQVALF